MRPSLLLLLVVATFALSCIGFTSAKNVRHLKQTTEEASLDAEGEERNAWQDALAKVKASGALTKVDDVAGVSKWKTVAEKMKAGQLAQLDDKVTATKWKTLSEKMKAGQLKNIDDEVAATSKWKAVAEKLQSGQLKNLDDEAASVSKWKGLSEKFKAGELKGVDTKNNKWQSAFTKLKATGQIQNLDETKVVKLTEGIAKEVAKEPKKWLSFSNAMKLVLGLGLTVLIVMGIQGMMA